MKFGFFGGKKEDKKKKGKESKQGTPISVGYSDSPDSYFSGGEAAESAFFQFSEGEDASLIIVAATLKDELEKIIKGIRNISKNSNIIGFKIRGLIFTGDFYVSRLGCALIAFNSNDFSVNISHIPTIHPEKFTEEFDVVMDNFFTDMGEIYKKGLTQIRNLAFFDSYQDGHEFIENYENKLKVKGELNIPMSGAILHPQNDTGDILLFSPAGTEKTIPIKNGMIFASIFSKRASFTNFAYGLHPTIPMRITKSEGKTVLEFNNKPAFIAYKEYLNKKGFNDDQIFKSLPDFFARYQFGFPSHRNPKQPEIRTVLKKTEEDGLVFTGDVSVNKTIWIMDSNPENLIKSTSEMLEKHKKEDIGAIIFSSLFRLLRLKKDYMNEIAAIQSRVKAPFVGFNTFAEFFYNNKIKASYHSSSNTITFFEQ